MTHVSITIRSWTVATLLLMVSSACTGRSLYDCEMENDPCSPPGKPFDAKAAVVFARCHPDIPPTAKLIRLVSFGKSITDLDSEGFATQWSLVFTHELKRYELNVAQPRIDVTIVTMSRECMGPAIVPLNSPIVVPDALQRFQHHDPDPLRDNSFLIPYVFQEATCNSPEKGTSDRVPILIIPIIPRFEDPFDTGNQFWDLYYDGDDFVRICGPCRKTGDPDCEPCHP